MSPAEHRRRSADRRTGEDRRGPPYRKPVAGPGADALGVSSTEPPALPLGRLFPYARLADDASTAPAAAIAAHRRDLSARLGREVGLLVAGLDYLLNISHDLVAPTIVEQEVLAMLERRSVTDPLTGLFNRYHFEATLQHELARSARHTGQVALVLMDVDQLKAVNDRWGHYAGDRVLGRVAGKLRESARCSDIACRFGGDEFAIILPDTDAPGARRAAERICSNVGASAPSPGPEAEVSTRITVSGGVAVWPLTARPTTETELIVAADQALYLAKRRGGNCIVEAAPAPDTGPAGAEGDAIR
jgi:diguanylate cyclase (GGDEF)-like protein